jgi:hypothetical protein
LVVDGGAETIVYAIDDAPDKSRAYCENLAKQLANTSKELPPFCQQYHLRPRNTHSAHSEMDAFAGMRPGSAAQARVARSKGQESHAQIQRRLTNGGVLGTRRFSKLDK